ncbi:MAG: acylneuraminate cytidylyltransferase family protein [Alphaproteobacteria bacterium]
MAWDGLTVLAVVPARGGSKSIPRKNLCKIGGRSLIAHTAATVAELDWIDHAIISTDDEEMAEEGRKFGLDVPFMRPAELAADLSTSLAMWRHAWTQCEAHYSIRFDTSILLQPTTPFRRPDEVTLTMRTMVEGGHKAAATVSPTPSHFTPHKALLLDEAGCLNFFVPDGAKHSIRQTAPPVYHRNGICYAVRRETLVEDGHIVEDDCAAVVIDRYLDNIDEPIELEFAEFALAKGHSQ